MKLSHFGRLPLTTLALLLLGVSPVAAAEVDSVEAELRALRSQNAALKAQVERQQAMIEEFARRHAALRTEPAAPAPSASPRPPEQAPARIAAENTATPMQRLGKLQLSGEGAVAYFGGQRNALFSKDVLRLDESVEQIPVPGLNAYGAMLDQFADVVRDGATPVWGAAQSRLLARWIDALHAASA